jgi:hypothetical protein
MYELRHSDYGEWRRAYAGGLRSEWESEADPCRRVAAGRRYGGVRSARRTSSARLTCSGCRAVVVAAASERAMTGMARSQTGTTKAKTIVVAHLSAVIRARSVIPPSCESAALITTPRGS